MSTRQPKQPKTKQPGPSVRPPTKPASQTRKPRARRPRAPQGEGRANTGPMPRERKPDPNYKATMTAYNARKTPGKKNIHTTGMRALRSALRPTSYDLFQAMVSPGEFLVSTGYPDNDATRSVVSTKINDNLSLKRPAAFTQDTYSVLFLSLPSIEVAGIAFFYDGTLDVGSEIRWDCMSTSDPLWRGEVVWWSDLTRDQVRPILTPALGNRDFNMIPECSFEISAAVAGTYNWTQANSTNLEDYYIAYRKLTGSITTELVASALTNQGTVYSRQMDEPVATSQVASNSFYFSSATATAAPTTQLGVMNARTCCLSGLATKFDALFAPIHFKGQASEGDYVIEKWDGHAKYVPVNQDRSLLAFNLSDREGVDYVQVPTNIVAPSGLLNLNTYAFVSLALDPNRKPSVCLYNGISKAAYVSAKVIGGFEGIPTLGGPYTYLATTPPLTDRNFLEMAEGVAPLIPAGAPASANDFMTTLKNIGETIWTVIKFAAPLIKLIL